MRGRPTDFEIQQKLQRVRMADPQTKKLVIELERILVDLNRRIADLEKWVKELERK